MSKPTIVMVGGAWHKPSIYSATAAILEKHDYATVSIGLPSAGAMPPHKDFNGDVSAIRDCVNNLVSDGKEVVLVLHSFGGFPGGEAATGLGKKEREAKGLEGGIIRYVVINGVAMPEGYQPHTDYTQFPEWTELDIENGIVTVPPEKAKSVFYHDLPSASADEFVSQLTHQSLGPFFSTTTSAAWKDIPSTFLISDDDRTPFRDINDLMIKLCQQSVPSAFNVVEHCKDAGHSVMASQPEWTANALRRAAGEKF